MDTHTEDFSPQESLRFIQSMIDKTKDSAADKSYYFLLWGWLVFIAALIQFVLKAIVKTDWNPMAWNLMFVGVIISFFYTRKEKGKQRVRTYLDDSIAYLWTAVGFTQGFFVFAFAMKGNWQDCYTFFILLYSLGCYVTGRILKFRPLIWGAIAGWLLAILTTFANFDYDILIMALAILVSYIIPGYLLRKEHRKKHHV